MDSLHRQLLCNAEADGKMGIRKLRELPHWKPGEIERTKILLKKTLLVLCAVIIPTASGFGGFGDLCNNFRRGDTNGDGTVDLSDGIATLTYLFGGASRPGCQDAADADDSGSIDLSDAVYTFQFLFLGGEPPPAPGPWNCGEDTRVRDDLGCEEVGACGAELLSRDSSNFDRFQLAFSPGLGFCPEVGRVFEATITKQTDGRYRVALVILRIGQPGEPCLKFFLGEIACAVPEALPARHLTADEIARMLALFTDLGVYLEAHHICDCIAIDPCRIGNFTWDGQRFSDFLCSNRRLADGQAQGILDFLESLR